PKRVAKILTEVTIGDDLTPEQLACITAMVHEYADIFALNLSEVIPVNFTKHKLYIDPTIPLPMKAYQKPLTAAQKPWFYGKIDEMEGAGVIAHV
ncbi:hypothetical protein K439DRAFT_1341164, partial [Ramaria rubella]